MYSSLHLRLCLYVFGQVLGSLCVCTYKCTRHTLRGSECWGKFSCLYLLSPRGMAGVTDIYSVSNLEVGSRSRTQVVRLAQHAHLSAKPELGSVHFKHGPLGLACRHSKSWCIYFSQRVCAFLLSCYLVMYHQPFLVKVKHKINYAVCAILYVTICLWRDFSCFMWMFENHWTKSLMQ